MAQPIVLYRDSEDEIRIPTRYEVCPRCGGEGTHDAWDGGMTMSEMAEHGEDFAEDYFAGRYDVPCSECKGKRVIAVPDEDSCSPGQLQAWREHEEARYEDQAEREAERRAGC